MEKELLSGGKTYAVRLFFPSVGNQMKGFPLAAQRKECK